MPKIVILPGDGVGPEVSEAAVRCLTKSDEVFGLGLEIEEHAFGGAAIDIGGEPLPSATLEACLGADAIFLGAIGGPNWDNAKIRPETGLLRLRKELGVFANLRPTSIYAGLEEYSPLRPDLLKGVDFLIVRELTGGLYFGAREEGLERATDQCLYTKEEVTRVARIAFEAARKRNGRVASVDKANVLATSRLWRQTVVELHAAEFSDIDLTHVLVDAMAMKLIQSPSAFDVILTENLFGDILSDEASVLAGSIGLAPSASLGAGKRGLFEPIHGSAPDIAGKHLANPIGAILSVAMLLRHSLEKNDAARVIERSVEGALRDGQTTRDIGGSLDTLAVAEAVCERIDAK